jgi:hypothetical protein
MATQVARGAGGKELTPAQKRALMNRYNKQFGTNITNMGQLDAAIRSVRDEGQFTGPQRRTITSIRNSFTGSS